MQDQVQMLSISIVRNVATAQLIPVVDFKTPKKAFSFELFVGIAIFQEFREQFLACSEMTEVLQFING